MHKSKLFKILVLAMIFSLVLVPAAFAEESIPTLADGTGDAASPATSHRLIVELDSPALAELQSNNRAKFDANAPDAQAYVSQLQAEQAAFVAAMQDVLTDATVSTFVNEIGAEEKAAYQVVFNGLSIDPGSTDKEEAKALLSRLDGVKNVSYDYAHSTQLYTSTALINADDVWNSAAIGGVANAGAGIKVASMDGGLHHEAPMFDGTGYEYPEGFGPDGIGDASNNNGKIIASRAYFRSWDPPAAGDENPWPGVAGTSHGVHTGSTAAGNCVDNVTYAGYDVGSMCGVAPKAWVMSYRVFYESVTSDGSFYNTEGIAALEDIAIDGADVLNNSWGGGPYSEGGMYDALDTALINVTKVGTFVSMSAGNAGPGPGTSDHPSSEYIGVAATSTSGTLGSGRLGIVDEPALQDIAFAAASFGGDQPDVGTVVDFPYYPSAVADASNLDGCGEWPAGTFDGKAALIKRGGCEFGVKVLNAENGGANFVVVYNHEAGGDSLINMGAGAVGDQATIASIFIGNTNGNAFVDYYTGIGAENAIIRMDNQGYQAGNIADRVVSFSSRGPGVGNVLKPDIAAPGVNILAQGFTPGANGEARHLGYGQASGTSMASPHVAGAAALLRQLYPDWSNAAIKSALMSTSQYMDIYTHTGAVAQPLDMGAGRLDVAAATDPGVILDPPSLSFANVVSGTQKTLTVNIANITDAAESYTLSTVYFGTSFTDTMPMAGITISPTAVTLNAGETQSVEVTFDSTTSMGYGDNQGYILMAGDQGHNAHMPAWARVGKAMQTADVLILDNDFSFIGPLIGELFFDYSWYYEQALDELGLTYEVYDVDANFGGATTIPSAVDLASYGSLIWMTGDNFRSDGSLSLPTGPTEIDQNKLTEYANNGGKIIAMGQDLAAVFASDETDGGEFFYATTLGANWYQDSISAFGVPTETIVSTSTAPIVFADVNIDISQPHYYLADGTLSGDAVVPPVDTATTGAFAFQFNIDENLLLYAVTVVPTTTTPISVTGAHIHQGAAGVNGGVLVPLDQDGVLPTIVTDSLTFAGAVGNLPANVVDAMLSGNFYINIHTEANPSGEVRGQIEPEGIITQYYVDEIGPYETASPNLGDQLAEEHSQTVLTYPGSSNLAGGGVGVVSRQQPSLEAPGVVNNGRAAYTSFGLENMYEGEGNTTRAELLGLLLNWADSEAGAASVADTTPADQAGKTTFTASYNGVGATAASYRWDFGDGSAYMDSTAASVDHVYVCSPDNGPNVYAVRVEVTDSMGNVAIGSADLDVSDSCQGGTAIDDEDPVRLPDEDSFIFLPVIVR